MTQLVKAGDGVTFQHRGSLHTGLVLKTWRRAAYVRLSKKRSDGVRWTVPYNAIVAIHPCATERRRKA